MSEKCESSANGVPWFPRKIQDLDRISAAESGEEFIQMIGSDRPGHDDKEYAERRKYFNKIAAGFRIGDVCPRVQYRTEEINTWKAKYPNTIENFSLHACKEFNAIFPKLAEECGFSEDSIPQWDAVTAFVKARTGFTFKLVEGFVSPRDFLSSLAFRVFLGTQYVRHHSAPFYTQEPDVCHDMLGHAAMFADPELAGFSQQIGLASLGLEEKFLDQVVSLYWYTVEFGMCKEDGQRKAFGAGILSSDEEMQNCMAEKANVVPFDAEKIVTTPYPLNRVQDCYFIVESLQDATAKIMEFVAGLPRPFRIRYDSDTQSVEVLDCKEHLLEYR